MDYSKTIKEILESNNNNLLNVCDELKIDRTLFKLNYNNNNNNNNAILTCSNSSYFFVYLEQIASFLALSFDRLCKSEDNSFIKSFQVTKTFWLFFV
jgi:hypothetical protein